ncbi:MAG TPA: hypothetical protein VNL15_06245 [Dehalococcoidia bacterium]|nr:hypothetical protein [Dehalococcoidia bacterium]
MTAQKSQPRPQAEEYDSETLALVAIEAVDDDLIVQELRGRAVEQWAYQLPTTNERGEKISGLTIAGVSESCRESARHGEAIRILDKEWRETEDAFYAIITAGRFAVAEDGREALLDTAVGTKRQAKRFWSKQKNGYMDDPFAFDKAISKAERNAKSKLLSMQVKQQVLALALQAGKVREVDRKEQETARKAQEKTAAPAEEKARWNVLWAVARRKFPETTVRDDVHDFFSAARSQGALEARARQEARRTGWTIAKVVDYMIEQLEKLPDLELPPQTAAGETGTEAAQETLPFATAPLPEDEPPPPAPPWDEGE